MKDEEYVINNADVLVDFLWNDVPYQVLVEAVQKMVDEGLIKIHEPQHISAKKAERI